MDSGARQRRSCDADSLSPRGQRAVILTSMPTPSSRDASRQRPRAVLMVDGSRPALVHRADDLRAVIEQRLAIAAALDDLSAPLPAVDADLAIVFGGDGSILRAARLMGINTDRVKVINFMLAAVLASLGGLLTLGFLNSVTHELKTPIASIRLYLETLQSREVGDAQRKEFYRVMLQDADRLQHTVEQVLRAGVARQKRRLEHRAPVDLSWLVQECVDTARTRHHLDENAITLAAPDPSAPLVVSGLLRRWVAGGQMARRAHDGPLGHRELGRRLRPSPERRRGPGRRRDYRRARG